MAITKRSSWPSPVSSEPVLLVSSNVFAEMLSLYHWLIVAFPACLVIRQIVAWGFLPDQPTSWSFLAWNGLIPLTLIPSLITQHVSLSKFETIVAMWLYTNSDETDQPPSHTDTELAKLVASTF